MKIDVEGAIRRIAVIAEWKRRNKIPLSQLEKNMLLGVGGVGREKYSRKFYNTIYMEGERDPILYQPIKVKMKFYGYMNDDPEQPDYYVLKSNHPMFQPGMNVSKLDIVGYGLEGQLPKTPTYAEWVKKGKPRYDKQKYAFSIWDRIAELLKSLILKEVKS